MTQDVKKDERGVILHLGKREDDFSKWYTQWSLASGISPDPDPYLHAYDYRKAFLDGVIPEISYEDGRYHWPSTYKFRKEVEGINHPNRFVKGYGDTTRQGGGIDPNVLGMIIRAFGGIK